MKNTKLTAFAIVALLCGTALAQTNWMDWRYGRPGVQVVTNAPSREEHTALSNLIGGVSGVNVSTVGTMITNAVGPLSSAILSNTTAITALSTGVVDHAAATNLLWTASGHYGTPGRLAGFFEGGAAGYSYLGLGLYFGGSDELSVSNEIIAGAALGATAVQPAALLPLVDTNALTAAIAVLETNTVTRAGTNGWETGSHAGLATAGDVAAAIAAIPASDAYTVRDSTDTNRWWRFEGSNAVQYALGAVVTNYTVTLSTNFLETVGNTRPAWTNNVFPFTDSDWSGSFDGGALTEPIIVAASGGYWQRMGSTTFPLSLAPLVKAQGTATVYQHVYYPTNATGNVLGPIPTNLVTYAQLLAWWIETEATKELHADSYTNLVWRSVFSNGWHWLVAYTNTP